MCGSRCGIVMCLIYEVGGEGCKGGGKVDVRE